MPIPMRRFVAGEVPGSLAWTMFDTLTWRGVKESDIDRHWTADYGAVRGCHGDAKHFQISVGTSRGNGAKAEHGATYYVQMKQVPNGYRIHTVTAQPDARCASPDLMAKP